jgi:hypothetical protein
MISTDGEVVAFVRDGVTYLSTGRMVDVEG